MDKWTKCADKLPPARDLVLVYGKNGIEIALLYSNFGQKQKPLKWFSNQGRFKELKSYTHWMHLPEKPTSELKSKKPIYSHYDYYK